MAFLPLTPKFLGPQFRQFRFTVGAPDAEARFYAAQMQAREQDSNAQQFPSVFVGVNFPSGARALFNNVLVRGSTVLQRRTGILYVVCVCDNACESY